MPEPGYAPVGMAEQTGVWALRLAKTLGHPGGGNVVNLVRARPKQDGFHDARHVARHAPAAFRTRRMMGVCDDGGHVGEAAVTSRAHQVWLIPELERGRVSGRVVAVWIVAGAAA